MPVRWRERVRSSEARPAPVMKMRFLAAMVCERVNRISAERIAQSRVLYWVMSAWRDVREWLRLAEGGASHASNDLALFGQPRESALPVEPLRAHEKSRRDATTIISLMQVYSLILFIP